MIMESPQVVAEAFSSTGGSLLTSLANNRNIVGSAWMLSSALFTTYSTTTFLKYSDGTLPTTISQKKPNSSTLSRPALLTLYRFGGSLLLGLIVHPDFRIIERFLDTLSAMSDFALPAAFLFIANYANSISLDRIGISLTYTSKCGIPLITVLLTLLLDGAQALPSMPTLLSLIPIAAGIAAASWNSPTFEVIGFSAAMISCTAQSALNVSSKHAMQKTGIAGAEAQRAMVAIGLAITLFLSLFQNKKVAESKPPTWLSWMAVSAYHIEYVLSFMFVKLVAPVAYGACDAVRRLCIIISGHWMFGGAPFSKLNLMGIGLALLGALSYSITSSWAP